MAVPRRARRLWSFAPLGRSRNSSLWCRAFILAAASACLALASLALPLLLADQGPGTVFAQRRSLLLGRGVVRGLEELGRGLLESASALGRRHLRPRQGVGTGEEQAEREDPCTLPDGTACAPEVTAAGPPESLMAVRDLSAEDVALLSAAAAAGRGDPREWRGQNQREAGGDPREWRGQNEREAGSKSRAWGGNRRSSRSTGGSEEAHPDVGQTRPRLAFLFLTRGPLPLAPLWERFFAVRHTTEQLPTAHLAFSGLVACLPAFQPAQLCSPASSALQTIQPDVYCSGHSCNELEVHQL